MLHDSLAGARPYIIDFGSLKRRGTTRKIRDDIRNLAMHLAEMANQIYSVTEPRSHYDDSVLAACEVLLAEMSDDDPLRRPEDPGPLLDQFDAHVTRGSLKQELTRPFDFGNAEEVMDNALLQKLAAKSFPWRQHIESSANMLVIGPRGCGKTTVFRSASFVCIADAGEIDDAIARQYIGLYISCNKDFRQRFSSLPGESLTRLGDEIRHYFALLVLRELTSSVWSCWQHERISPGDVAKYAHFVRTRARIELPDTTQPEAILREIETSVARSIHAARMAIWGGEQINGALDQGFLADVARFTHTELSPFAGKVLFLFVDDYTERKVPREAQRALNHILFVPNSDYKVKISSEVFGVTPDQTVRSFILICRLTHRRPSWKKSSTTALRSVATPVA
jgi:energy-coupling factor transporter ATP-binding protein EcfA2